MSRLRRAAKATIIAQCFNGTNLLLSLVTVPLYLSWLGEERYGLLLTGIAIAGYLMFSDAGITWASMLLIAEANGRDDRPGIASIFRNSFPLALLSSLLVLVVVAGLLALMRSAGPLAWIPQHPELPGLLLAIGISVVLQLLASPVYNLFTGLQEMHLASIYQGIGRLAGTFASVGLAAKGMSLGWVYGGNFAGFLLAGVGATIHCRQRHAFAFATGPMWEPAQIRRQIRTGLKSLVMQVGIVLSGTAPVFALSFGAGPQYVPLYAVPLSLINAPLSLITSFSASLQAGCGEAMGRGERGWVAGTVRRILRQLILVSGLLGVGFLLIASTFVTLWTVGKIEVPAAMIASVLAIAVTGAFLGTLRYALTGINRHREAAVADLIAGSLAMVASLIAVRIYGTLAIGITIVAVTALTTGWLFPRALRRSLETTSLWPDLSFWGCWLVTTLGSYAAGSFTWKLAFALPPAGQILITGTVVTLLFLGLVRLLLRDDLRLRPATEPLAKS